MVYVVFEVGFKVDRLTSFVQVVAIGAFYGVHVGVETDLVISHFVPRTGAKSVIRVDRPRALL